MVASSGCITRWSYGLEASPLRFMQKCIQGLMGKEGYHQRPMIPQEGLVKPASLYYDNLSYIKQY